LAGLALLSCCGGVSAEDSYTDLRRAVAEGKWREVKELIRYWTGEEGKPLEGDRHWPDNLARLLLSLHEHAALKHYAGRQPEPVRSYLIARVEPKRAAFEKVLALDPAHRGARRVLAVMDADDGRYAAAKIAFETLLREESDDTETMHRFAFAAYYGGEPDLALDLWGSAVEADPDFAEPWYGLGVAWLGKGLWVSAEKAFRRALEADPVQWKAQEGMVQAMAGQGRWGDAEPVRRLLRERAAVLKSIPREIKVAVVPTERGARILKEALDAKSAWLYRLEVVDQEQGGGKPIRILELRRAGEGAALGEVDPAGSFREMKTFTAVPAPETLLSEE
jgi:tetratricopeptide (TPR) repeat protein